MGLFHRIPLLLAGCALLAPAPATFELPCDGYLRGLHGKGNFGVRITQRDSPFFDSWHLAEDVWLPAGTDVRSVADGVVRFSNFSPSWTGADGRMHWNLGNVVVVEHRLDPPEVEGGGAGGLDAVCSFYVHLAAHFHFGIHRGPYFQITPTLRRELEQEARSTGIVAGDGPLICGEIVLVPQSESSVLVRAQEGGASFVLSLLVGSTAPGRKPADIMSWCCGYGERATVDEWLAPSRWIAAHAAATRR